MWEMVFTGQKTQQYQSTEGESYKGKQPRKHKENTKYTRAYTYAQL